LIIFFASSKMSEPEIGGILTIFVRKPYQIEKVTPIRESWYFNLRRTALACYAHRCNFAANLFFDNIKSSADEIRTFKKN